MKKVKEREETVRNNQDMQYPVPPSYNEDRMIYLQQMLEYLNAKIEWYIPQLEHDDEIVDVKATIENYRTRILDVTAELESLSCVAPVMK